ncbi:MAG: serine hydrolase domain-containing protein [Capsulimonadales bacterium]|nr:serine hydrolase domain-containing protein [Capsulimonadales bacterium]
MRHYHVPGLQVAVLVDGKMVAARGYGLADPSRRRSVTDRTLFDAGSISKAVTALAVVKLADEGRISLDAPINTLLRSWHLPENELTRQTPVTVRHLLTHTAGTNVSGFWGYTEKQAQPTLRQILDGLPPASNAPIRVENPPGKAWRYSGGGYVILQQMLEDVTGKPFAEAMEDLVLRPLGMTRSTFVQGLPPALRRDVAVPTSEASYFAGRRVHPHAAAAGLYTTAPDLALFVAALCRSYRGETNAFLSREMARQMVEPTILDREPWDRSFPNRRNTQKDQALGLMRISRNGAPGETKYAYHDGINAGFRSRLMFQPKTGQGVILLVNSDGDEEFLLEATRAVASAFDWKDWVSDPIHPIRLSSAELDRYVGRYRRNADTVVTIRREGNHLLWQDLYTAAQPVYPIGEGRFEHRELFGRPSVFLMDKTVNAGRAISLDGWPRLPDSAPFVASEYLLAGKLSQGTNALRADSAIDGQRIFEMAFNLLEIHRMPKAAVAVFRVGTEKSPGAPGAWDALGDALKRAGDRMGGEQAEARATRLRTFQDRLSRAYEENGVKGGTAEYARLRREFGALPLGDMLRRLSTRFRESGKIDEADSVSLLDRRALP